METLTGWSEPGEGQGLNRTMQYGNCSIPYKDNCALSFKSYYVVWKHTFAAGAREDMKV